MEASYPGLPGAFHLRRAGAGLAQDFLAEASRDCLPVRLVAFESNALAGTIVLRRQAADFAPGYQPGLGGLFVVATRQRHGAGYECLYATTAAAAGILAGLGWERIETVTHEDEQVGLYRCRLYGFWLYACWYTMIRVTKRVKEIRSFASDFWADCAPKAANRMDTSLTLKRSAVNFGIVLIVAIIHIFRLGSYMSGGWYNFYYSYFSDFILPFTAYFLICNVEFQLPIRRRWGVKFALALMTPAIAETCQYFGVPVLGATFDLLDYLFYGLGALAAVLVDTQVFSRVFDFWDRGQ